MLHMLPARGVSKSKLHRIARARTCDTSEVAETNRDSNREISSSIPEEQGKEKREEEMVVVVVSSPRSRVVTRLIKQAHSLLRR